MSLPGVTTVIKDGFKSLLRTDIPVGPRVLAIGTRSTASGTGDIEDLDPYNAAREEDVMTVFGADSQLHRAFVELAAGGAQRVTLVALPSDTVFDHTTGTLSVPSHATYTAGSETLLTEAFAAAEAARADIIVPWGRGTHPNDWESPATPANDPELGFHADNASTTGNSWARKIANLTASITSNSHPCFAVLGVKPFLTGLAEGMTPVQTAAHLTFPNLVSRSVIGDNGIYLSVIASEMKPLGYDAAYGYSNGAGAYAGAAAQLDSWSAPTGKTIFNVDGLRYNPTRTQQQALIDKGLVPVAVDYNRTPTWVDAMTFSKPTSDYTRLTTLRIVFDAVLTVRQVAQRFIGEGSSLSARNALETAITAGLRGMQQLGALLASDFQVTYVPAESRAVVDLILTPAFELRNIEVSVSVQL